MIESLPQPPIAQTLASSDDPKTTVYYLAWRARRNHPWRSEEFESRLEAHRRYLSLLERGVEAYLERRRIGSL